MSHTVLSVEDNADIREILKITLSDAGFAVVAGRNCWRGDAGIGTAQSIRSGVGRV